MTLRLNHLNLMVQTALQIALLVQLGWTSWSSPIFKTLAFNRVAGQAQTWSRQPRLVLFQPTLGWIRLQIGTVCLGQDQIIFLTRGSIHGVKSIYSKTKYLNINLTDLISIKPNPIYWKNTWRATRHLCMSEEMFLLTRNGKMWRVIELMVK